MHQHAGEPVRLGQGNQADDGGEQQTVLEREAQQVGLTSHQPGGGAGDGDGLRRDHFASHAAAGVGGHHQHVTHTQLVRGGGLQRAEQGVGRGVRAGEEYTEPAQERREERECGAGTGQDQRHGGGHAREVGDEGEGQHHADGQGRPTQFEQGFTERLERGLDVDAQHHHRDDRGKQNRRAGGRDRVELEHGRHWCGGGDDGRGLQHQLVQVRDGEVEDEVVHGAAWSEHRLERLQGPDGDEYGQDQERRPGLEDLPQAVGRWRRATNGAGFACWPAAHHGCATADDDRFAAGRALGLPDFEEQGQADDAGQGRGDVGQFRADEVGGQVLHDGEAQACDQRRGPGFPNAAQAVHDEHQPERYDQRQQRQLAAGHGADLERVDAGHLTRDDDRDAQGAEGHRRGVGDQAQPCGVERVEAQAHQQGSGNRHRRAEACRPFQKRAEAEADQQHLQALVVGDGQHRAADNFELAALHRQLVEEHGGHDDPGDRPQAVHEAVTRGGQRHVGGHAIGEDGQDDGQRQRDAAGDVPLHAKYGQRQEEEHDGNDGNQGGQPEASERVVDLLPGLHKLRPLVFFGRLGAVVRLFDCRNW